MGRQPLPLSWVTALLFIDAAMNVQEDVPVPPPLPSAVHCAALFAVTVDGLSHKSGDPEMTAAFVDDAAALRRIVIAGVREWLNAEAVADAAITAEKKVVIAEAEARRVKGDDTPVDLKPCYRVKALGPRGE